MTDKDRLLNGEICPYCFGIPELVDSSVVYGKSYGPIWYCKPCGAYCGCHKGTNKALGRLADKKLRTAKKEAHKYFDLLWKGYGSSERVNAYKWLSKEMNLDPIYTHIGMFDIDQCKLVIEKSKLFLKDVNRLNNTQPFLNF